MKNLTHFVKTVCLLTTIILFVSCNFVNHREGVEKFGKIYVLYLDQLLSDYDYNNAEKSTSNKILVFDYDGNNIAGFNLDCRIQEMAVLAKGRKLYGLTQYPDFSLIEFVLPDELYN